MRQAVGGIRLLAAVASGIAVVVTAHAALDAQTFRFFDFFGYFTIQGSIVTAVTLGIAGATTLAGHSQSEWLLVLRGSATTYIVIVGVVYNALLRSIDVGVLVPWANTVMHVALPLYAVVDCVVAGDRGPLAWRRMPLVLVYPIVWVLVVLGRQVVAGADGWVPYPFLELATLGGAVWAWIGAIAAAFVAVAALVWWASRLRVLRF